MKENKYFLVGMPASGKSSIGKLLASQLGFDFIDLDKVIVQREDASITEIFSEKGEDYFRGAERKYLLELVNKEGGFVLATGGGAPCFYNNMADMNKSGITIFLNVALEDLFNKLSKKGTHKRPLLKDKTKKELYEELASKLDERIKYYEQSKIILNQRFTEITYRVNQVIFAIKSLEE